MSTGNRDITLDLMKSLLVIGMITAHVLQLCYVGGSKLVAAFSLFINMVTFSSFMFCFGCAAWLAYFRKYPNKMQVKGKLFRNFIRLLICFYISGYGFLLLVDSDFTLYEAVKVLLLWRIPGYSEFLLSFAFLNLVIYVLYPIIQKLIVNKYKIGGVFCSPSYQLSCHTVWSLSHCWGYLSEQQNSPAFRFCNISRISSSACIAKEEIHLPIRTYGLVPALLRWLHASMFGTRIRFRSAFPRPCFGYYGLRHLYCCTIGLLQ